MKALDQIYFGCKVKNHLFSTFAKFSEKSNSSYPLIHTRASAYRGGRNVRFSENSANVLNECSRSKFYVSKAVSKAITFLKKDY